MRPKVDFSDEKRMKVCFLAQVFVRNSTDSIAPFLFVLAKALTRSRIELSVVCPHAAGLKGQENIKGINVDRFRYAPERFEVLAYRGMMHELIFESILNRLIFVFFRI